MKKWQKFYLLIKRLIGLLGSIVAILLCVALFWWWILPINAIVTKGHPFFVQERLGYHKKVFKLVKFRSMKINAPVIPPSEMTAEKQKSLEIAFGRFLRKSSLDETPQLLNVFIGQMSFIGPRPGAAKNEEVLVKYRESYTPNAYDVRPGMSGYAQTRMARAHDPAQKAWYDAQYVCRISLWMDTKIFFYTAAMIFFKAKGR